MTKTNQKRKMYFSPIHNKKGVLISVEEGGRPILDIGTKGRPYTVSFSGMDCIYPIERFQVVGMTKPNSFTFSNDNGCWWAKSGLDKNRFNALFSWAKGDDTFWKQHVLADVYFKGKSSDGTPIGGVVIKIEVIDL